jgi:hypothetical protein
MAKHTIVVGLKDKGGTQYDGVRFEITLPDGIGVNQAHVTEFLEKNSARLGYAVDMSSVKLGESEIAFAEFGGIEWAVESTI